MSRLRGAGTVKGPSRDAVLVIDDARTIVEANAAASALVGIPTQELRGRRWDDFLDPAVDMAAAWHELLEAGEQIGEWRVMRPDGEARRVEYDAMAAVAAGRHLVIVRDIADGGQARLDEREALHLRESETLLAVSRALSSTLDPTETMRRVAREISLALGADMVGAYLADAAHESLSPVAGYHVPRDMLDAFLQYPIPIRKHPAIEEAWAHRQAVWTDDMPADPRVDPDTLRRFPHQSDVFVPIRVKDRPVGGFFVIWWTARRAITPWELRLLQGISDLAGIFLENAQLYRESAEANRAKDEFLATLSHELRNPLGAIANAVAALTRRASGGDDATERLRQIIRRQTDHLTRLVDDLLDVARATAGKIVLSRQPVDLSDVVGGCVRLLRESGRARRHRVTFQAESLIVNADPTRLAQIVNNMLDNAVKFTPQGGAIDVDVRRDGEEGVVQVTDTGIGIDPAMLPRIFELFTQAEQGRDRSLGGLGIGLTLSQRLVAMHGGTITAASEGRERGAQFTVRLPLELVGKPSQAPAAVSMARSRSVLIIEDNADARHSLRLLLESLGHQVLEAGDGAAGLALARAQQPDVVLIDLGLPELDGFEVARSLRAGHGSDRMVLIAVTGYGQAEDRRRSREAGFDAHLVKPVSPAVLSTLIAAA